MKLAGLVIVLTFAALSWADPIPTLTFTSGTGSVVYAGTAAHASISGPDYDLTFLRPGDSHGAPTFTGASFPDDLPLNFNEITGAPIVPGMSITLGGTTYNLLNLFDSNVTVKALAQGTVPQSGTGSLVLPAMLTGGGMACTVQMIPVYPFSLCGTEIANVDFDIPGNFAASFTPTGTIVDGQELVDWSAVFTPSPEPSSVLLMLAGLVALGAFRSSKIRRALRDRFAVTARI